MLSKSSGIVLLVSLLLFKHTVPNALLGLMVKVKEKGKGNCDDDDD